MVPLLMSIAPDKYLLRQISQHDRDAFRIFYQYYIPSVYQFTYSLLKDSKASEEIVQCVFIKVWDNRETMIHVLNCKSYLFKIAKNLILNHYRKQQLIQKSAYSIHVHEPLADSPEEQYIYKEDLQLAEEAIAQLSPKRKQIVELRTKQDLSLDEIAEKLRISKNVVKKQLYKGMAFIKDYLIKRGRLTLWLLLYLFIK